MLKPVDKSHVKLSADQGEARSRILDWLEGPKQTFILAGPAGSGKTTLIRSVVEHVSSSRVLAPSNKASQVLRDKGLDNAQTIHNFLYNYIGYEIVNGKQKLNFEPKQIDGPVGMVIVDEGSMVSLEMYNDLTNLRDAKLLFVGDDFQLGPVDPNPDNAWFNVMSKPDFELSLIHRQGKLSSIRDVAWSIRFAEEFCCFNDVDLFAFPPDTDLAAYAIQHAINVTLCATNRQRKAFNESYRKIMGYDSCKLCHGELVTIVRNDHDLQIWNGQTAIAQSVIVDDERATFLLEDSRVFDLPYSFSKYKFDRLAIDYGYASTVHRAQGSEYDRVLFVNSDGEFVTDRLRYTAVTRAKHELHIATVNEPAKEQ